MNDTVYYSIQHSSCNITRIFDVMEGHKVRVGVCMTTQLTISFSMTHYPMLST